MRKTLIIVPMMAALVGIAFPSFAQDDEAPLVNPPPRTGSQTTPPAPTRGPMLPGGLGGGFGGGRPGRGGIGGYGGGMAGGMMAPDGGMPGEGMPGMAMPGRGMGGGFGGLGFPGAMDPWQRQRQLLSRPVDVQLHDATVAQAAGALQEASNLNIRVDRGVPTETRLTVDARGVPLATVLDSVASQAHLMIAPDPRGLVLKPWPYLEVNGQKTDYAGHIAPWSDDWGVPPTAAVDGGGGLVFTGPMDGLPGRDPFPSMAPVTLTAVGNLVLAAQPGFDGQGEPGVWLTVYQLEGTVLKKVSSRFDRSEQPMPAARLTGRAPGMGRGMPPAPASIPTPGGPPAAPGVGFTGPLPPPPAE